MWQIFFWRELAFGGTKLEFGLLWVPAVGV
jgi:hypothetical protein